MYAWNTTGRKSTSRLSESEMIADTGWRAIEEASWCCFHICLPEPSVHYTCGLIGEEAAILEWYLYWYEKYKARVLHGILPRGSQRALIKSLLQTAPEELPRVFIRPLVVMTECSEFDPRVSTRINIIDSQSENTIGSDEDRSIDNCYS